MSALSLQITRACRENPDLELCKFIYVVAPIIFLFATIALSFVIYTTTFKDKDFRKKNKENKLAILSFWSCIMVFMIGTSLQILGFLSESLDMFRYSFIPLIGTTPLLLKNKDDFLNPIKEIFAKSSIKEKIKWGVVTIIILMGICSWIYVFASSSF